MIFHVDVFGAAAAALVLVAAAPVVAGATGRSRSVGVLVGVGSAVAVMAAEAPVAAVALLVAGLAARLGCPADDAAAAAWAFLGDAVVAAGLGAAALDAADPKLPWIDGDAARGWAMGVVAVGALVRLTTNGTTGAPVVVAAAAIGVRLAGLPPGGDAPVWLVGAVAIAVASAWAGRPAGAVAGLGWAALGIVGDGAGAGALLLAGAAVVVAGDAVAGGRLSAERGGWWGRLRSRSPTPPPTATGMLAALALVPAGVALVQVATDDAPETVLVLIGLLAVAALTARAPGVGGLPHPVAAGVAATLTVPLLAPGWWADRLEIAGLARGATDALTAGRPGAVAAVIVAGAVGPGLWAAARARDRSG